MRRRETPGAAGFAAAGYPADRCESLFLAGVLGRPEALLTAPRSCRNRAKFFIRVEMMRELAPYEYDEAWCCLRHRNTFLTRALGPEPTKEQRALVTHGPVPED